MPHGETERDRVLRSAREALESLTKNNAKNWSWWLDVGHALVLGRKECMTEAGIPFDTNKPPNKYGGKYNRAFSAWMKAEGIDIDPGDRSRLLHVMDNLGEITVWRDKLTDKDRRNLNHPSTVLRRWNALTKTASAKPRHRKTAKSASDKERDRVVKLLGMLGSNQAGEQANAATMIYNMARSRKQTIPEFMRSVFMATA